MSQLPTDPSQLAEAILHARFTPRRLRTSYAMGPVDEVLDRAAAAIQTGQSLGPVLQDALPTVRFREGYDIEQVDALIDELRARG